MTATMPARRRRYTQTQPGGVVAPSSEPDHIRTGNHCPRVGSDTLDRQPANEHPTPEVASLARGDSSPPTPPTALPSPLRPAVEWEAYTELRLYAECLADAMDHRIAIGNRLRSGTVPADVVAELAADLNHTEKILRRGMVTSFRRAAPEVAAWTKETVGLGEETMARLIGTIGHPVVARPHHWEGEGTSRQLVADEPYLRTVSQLWSYCGHGDPARRRRKGMSADDAMGLGSPHAKKLVYLLAVACMKCAGSEERPPAATVGPEPDEPSLLVDPSDPTGQERSGTRVPHAGGSPPENADAGLPPEPVAKPRRRSPYRDTYDNRRAITADRDDWTLGHRNADALRLTGKAILRDLWVVSRNAMEEA